MKQYRTVFFDLYGTLVDIHTDEAAPAFWKQTAKLLGLCAGDWNALKGEYLSRCAAEQSALEAEAPVGALVELDLGRVFRSLLQAHGRSGSAAEIRSFAWDFRRLSTAHLRAYAGAAELLQMLRRRGVEVVLLSNAQSLFTLPELDKLGLRDCFDRILISSDCGRKKPDPAFFRLGLGDRAPQDCLMIGNDPVCDIAGAAAVGMDTWYIRSALSPKEPAELPAAPTYRQPHMDLRAICRILEKELCSGA